MKRLKTIDDLYCVFESQAELASELKAHESTVSRFRVNGISAEMRLKLIKLGFAEEDLTAINKSIKKSYVPGQTNPSYQRRSPHKRKSRTGS